MTILVAQSDQRPPSIPSWVTDLQSFRRWAGSDEFPESGWYSYLGGDLWVDTSMERVQHNKLKGKIDVVLTTLVEEHDSGDFFHDRMFLTHVEADLSTEPDGMFVSHHALASGRAELKRGPLSVEVLGTPDMVLEVVSQSSRQKDRVVLRELYDRAKIPEYWTAEPFSDRVELEVLVWQPDGYGAASNVDGWVQSLVFGQSFRITVSNNRSGNPVYRLEAR